MSTISEFVENVPIKKVMVLLSILLAFYLVWMMKSESDAELWEPNPNFSAAKLFLTDRSFGSLPTYSLFRSVFQATTNYHQSEIHLKIVEEYLKNAVIAIFCLIFDDIGYF
jgi:hypothetical protein